MFDMELVTFKIEDIASIDAIYQEAFPEEERFPLEFLLQNVGKIGKLEVLKEKEEVLGFVYLLVKDDLVHIFFLAVSSIHRGNGLGGIILENIKDKYVDKRIFLALEALDDKAINYTQRQKRALFYTRHGFKYCDIHIFEREIYFDVMSIGDISTKDYDDMILAWCGPEAKEYYRMNAI